MPASTQLDLAAGGAGQASAEHKRFQKLLANIEQARARLADWHRQLPLFGQAHERTAAPAIARLWATRRACAFELEQLLMGGRWSKAERESLSGLIGALALALLAASARHDDELKALFNRHGAVDVDHVDRAEPRARITQTVEAAEPASSQHHQRPRRTAAQKRAAQDELRISQTVRQVYRKLASALHPDRIKDSAARAVATTQMQRANVAYEAGDLLALLELQLQIEQIDMAHAAGIAAEQVRHFNKVLAEQLCEIEKELDERQMAFCATYGLLTDQRLDPNKLGLLLKDEMRELAANQTQLDHTRRLLRGDAASVKRWLKGWRTEQRAAAFDERFF